MRIQLVKVKRICFVTIFLVAFVLSALLFSVTFMSESNSGSLDNTDAITHNENSEELRNSLSVGNTSFGDVGNEQNAQLTHLRNEAFENNHTDNGDLMLSNLKSGWNMSNFGLNFTELSAQKTYVDFQTRVDGGDSFKETDVSYATSFQIPNTCKLRNISMFIQYWGSENVQHNQSFSISIFNATANSGSLRPDASLNQPSDDTLIDLSGQGRTSIIKWYQANFSNRILDISKTKNRTFFAVFKTLMYNMPNPQDSSFFSANKHPDDPYDSTLYEKSGTGQWSKMEEKSGCLKVNLAPISSNPNPEQVNLTVFDQKVPESGFFEYDQLISPTNDRYNIPVSSLWFSDITY
ncbi:MAG: hypothetical protein R6U96_08770, partial [Promethearchaeia archaeon]